MLKERMSQRKTILLLLSLLIIIIMLKIWDINES